MALSIQDIAEMSLSDAKLLREFDVNISIAESQNVSATVIYNAATDDVKTLLSKRNSAYSSYYNLAPPILPYRLSGGAEYQIPDFPPTDEMSRVHTTVLGAKVNNLATPNFLDTLGPVAEDEAAFIPPDPLEDKIFLDSSTYDVNSTRKIVTMIAYEFSDKPYLFGTVGGISVANVAGGLVITVIGDHFQPSGFAVARFTEVQSWFAYFAALIYINKTHAYFVTPKLSTAVATYFQVSNNGYIYSQTPASVGTASADDGFGFYEIISRRPVSGSAVGRTGLVFRGEFLNRVVKAKALCDFGSCDGRKIQTLMEWSEDISVAVCFSPPMSRCSEIYVASEFKVLVGYEILFQDVWFYVVDQGPTIMQARFDPSLRTIIVTLRANTNLGNYNRSESCAKLFTVESQRIISASTVA
jgi:hypothetical protein